MFSVRGRFGSKQARLRHLCVYVIAMFFLMYALPSIVIFLVAYRFSATAETSGSGGEALLGNRVLHFGMGALQTSFMAFVVVGAGFLDFFFEQCFHFSLRTTRMMCSSSRLRHLCIYALAIYFLMYAVPVPVAIWLAYLGTRCVASFSLNSHYSDCRFGTMLGAALITSCVAGSVWSLHVVSIVAIFPSRYLWWPRGSRPRPAVYHLRADDVKEGRLQVKDSRFLLLQMVCSSVTTGTLCPNRCKLGITNTYLVLALVETALHAACTRC